MVKWSVEFTSDSDRDLAKLDRTVRRRVINKLEWLARNFDILTHLPLSGEFRDFYKLRVGDWRAIYKIVWEKNKVIVYNIDKRDRVYKLR